MKKIICLLLALSVIFASMLLLGSCKKEDERLEQFAEAVSSVAATKIVSMVECDDGSEQKLGGVYSVEIEGENSISSYDFWVYRSIEEGANDFENGEEPELLEHIVGTAYYKDGRVSYDGSEWVANNPVAVVIRFNLDTACLSNTKISDDGTTLTATLTPENAKKVLGADVNAKGDVSLTVQISSSRLTQVSVAYTTKSGNSMSIMTSYSYSTINLSFPEAQ